MKGSTAARKTDDGLEVTCWCEETFTLPAEGGKHTCRCGTVHRFDGDALRSVPGEMKR